MSATASGTPPTSTGGLGVFGSVDCEAACDATGQGPWIDVSSYGGFGSVEVLTETELATDGDWPL